MPWLTFFCALCLLGLSACSPGVLPAATGGVSAGAVLAQAPAAAEGGASWYGPGFAGRRTASGEVFDPTQLTAAHKTLPFGTQVRVTNLNNGRSVIVRINDRGPFKPGRIIDLSRAAAEQIGMIGSGTARVRLEPLSGATSHPPVLAVVDSGLKGYSVISPRYPLGALLLLGSASTSQPLMVRVVPGEIPQGVDMLISPDLYSRLGESITVLSR